MKLLLPTVILTAFAVNVLHCAANPAALDAHVTHASGCDTAAKTNGQCEAEYNGGPQAKCVSQSYGGCTGCCCAERTSKLI